MNIFTIIVIVCCQFNVLFAYKLHKKNQFDWNGSCAIPPSLLQRNLLTTTMIMVIIEYKYSGSAATWSIAKLYFWTYRWSTRKHSRKMCAAHFSDSGGLPTSWTETPWTENPWTESLLNRDPSWTETPLLDRNPPHGQNPSFDRDPIDREPLLDRGPSQRNIRPGTDTP